MNPFKVGDTVILRKPSTPYPTTWPPEQNTYAFGIHEDDWNMVVGKNREVTSLTTYRGCPGIVIDGSGLSYCWPIEYVDLAILSSTGTGKVPCNCPSIFIRGCQNKKGHI